MVNPAKRISVFWFVSSNTGTGLFEINFLNTANSFATGNFFRILF